MSYSLVMLRRGTAHAVKVTTAADQVVFKSTWSDRPEVAVAEARQWLLQNLKSEDRRQPGAAADS